MRDKIPYIFILSVALCLAGGTTGTPRILKVNGHTRVYTEKKVLGVPYSTKVEEIKTLEQAKADIEVKALEDQQRTEAKRASIALWMGAILLVAACVCTIIGYFTHGWKRWGGLALLCITCGGLCWGFVEWIDKLKWFALALPVVAVGLFLYDNKEKGKGE